MSRTREGAEEANDHSQAVQSQPAAAQHANQTPVLNDEASATVAPVFTSRDLAEIIGGTNNRGTIFTGRDLADIIGGNSQRESSAVFKSVDSFVSKFNSKDSYGKIPFQFHSNDEQNVRGRRRLDSMDTLASTEVENLYEQSPVARQNSSGFPCTNSVDTISVAPFAVARESSSPTTMELTMDALDVLSGKMKRSGPSGFNAMFASNDWQGNFRTEHVDVEYHGMFSSLDRHQQEALKMLSEEIEHPKVRASSTAQELALPRTDWMKEFHTIFNQSNSAQSQSVQQAFEPDRAPTTARLKGESPADVEGAPTAETQAVPKTDWMREFNTIFSQASTIQPQSLPVAPQLAPPSTITLPPIGEESASNSTCTPATVQEAKKKKVKKRRSQEPEVKEYIDNPTNDDVLLGRGGRSNHHSGNKRYRDEIIALQTLYRDASKDGKTEISQLLVDRVRSYGGRFLKLDESVHRWYLVKNIVARRKASQALRETNTPEVRQAKRERLAKKRTGGDYESMESESV